MIISSGRKSKYVKTKIVATIGPATAKENVLRRLIRNGLSVARLNFSHGTHQQHVESIKLIRKISEDEGVPIAILQDLCGPKIRLGKLPEPIELKKNQMVKISTDKDSGDLMYTEFKQLPDAVKPGDAILINDGYIELKVTGVDKGSVSAKVMVPGIVSSGKGINLPNCNLKIPCFTEKDRTDLEFGLNQGIDMVAMSFVDHADAIKPVKKMMDWMLVPVPVIAKIERPVALKHIDAIIDAFDGIMVARGDLGVEVSPEQVPIIQKKLINKANEKNKLVITATQMLESMINNPRPTRAEASDVSNAILDGSDAVMLSGETAVGKYPVRAVNMMRKIAQTTEASKLYSYSVEYKFDVPDNTEAIVKSAAHIAEDLNAKYILVYTFSGNTARIISKYRANCPVFAFSPQKDVVTKINAFWGIFPQYIEFSEETDEMIHRSYELLKNKGLVKPGELIVSVSGVTPMEGATNMLKVTRFGE